MFCTKDNILYVKILNSYYSQKQMHVIFSCGACLHVTQLFTCKDAFAFDIHTRTKHAQTYVIYMLTK